MSSSLALRLKLSLIVIAVIGAVMGSFGWLTVRDIERSALAEARNRLIATNGVLMNMIAANQDGLKIALLRLGTVFRQHFQGVFALDENRTVNVAGVSAPLLRLNGKVLNLDQRVIDEFTRKTGGSVATVFARVGDDFLRVSTSLLNEQGRPAVGTFLGDSHPAYRKILQGETYQGQARLFGRHYMTEYTPVFDASRRVVGILFVGMDLSDSLQSLLERMHGLTIEQAGYVFIIDANAGDGYGRFLLHPAKQGQKALAGEEGGAAIGEMLAQQQGVLEYLWRNHELGEASARRKMAAFSRYSELGWVVGASGYFDDIVRISLEGRRRMILAIVAVSLLAVLAINLAVSRWVVSPMLRLQQKLRDTGQTLRTLINAVPDVVVFKDSKGRWIEANDVARQTFGLAAGEQPADRGGELVEAFDIGEESAWRAQAVTEAEVSLRLDAGETKTFDVTRVPLFEETGGRKGLVVIGRDITERRRREAQQRLAARVFDTTGEAIMVIDKEARIVLVNPAFCRITGYAPDDVLGRSPKFLNSGRHGDRFYRGMFRTLRSTGEWAGEVWSRRKDGDAFPEWLTVSSVPGGDGDISHYVAIFADLSEIRKAEAAAERLSWRDSLTGLANRALFIKSLGLRLVNAHRDGQIAHVLLLDLDRFKEVNEVHGFSVGDALLRAVALRLQQSLQEQDLVARLDSDEFAIMLLRPATERNTAGREVLATAERILAVLQEQTDIDGETVHLDASIGIALFPESPLELAPDILRQADMAMHRAKEAGGGRAVFFETAMGEAIKVRYDMERELRQAIDGEQLRLYLQPQVDGAARQVGAEALVRWQHPQRGLVPPGNFIPLAEMSELIVTLDRWVFAKVLDLLRQLEVQGIAMQISVNISPRHFGRDDFVDEVKRRLTVSGVNPGRLLFEVTENLMIGDLAGVIGKMRALSVLGIRFSMDDFGTGYSSLSNLKRLPIHELKIDKSFIDDIPDDQENVALVETILAVAKHLNLAIIAEGVETEAQAGFLAACGEVVCQGYLYGRPEPAETWLVRLLAARNDAADAAAVSGVV